MTGKSQDKSDDLIERLNFFWTCTILAVFISCVGVVTYVFPTSALTCWTPQQFLASYTLYTHRVCSHTENLQVMDNTQNSISTETKSNVVNMPIASILLCMLFGFKIPQLFKILTGVSKRRKLQPVRDTTSHELDQLVLMVQESIVHRSNFRFVALLIVKALLVLNLFIQFVFITAYFQETTITETISTRNASGFNDTVTTGRTPYFIFPKTVQCSFYIRQLSNFHLYFVECEMPINYLYEMFFNLYWFWIIVLGVLTLVAAIAQIASLLVRPLKEFTYVSMMTDAQEASVDTLLILRDIEAQYGLLITRRVTSRLKLSAGNAAAMHSVNDEIPLMTIQQHMNT